MPVIKILPALHNITQYYIIYMVLQSGMFHYMLVQLHACYMILHAFTVNSRQLQALHANPVGPAYFKIGGSYRISM